MTTTTARLVSAVICSIFALGHAGDCPEEKRLAEGKMCTASTEKADCEGSSAAAYGYVFECSWVGGNCLSTDVCDVAATAASGGGKGGYMIEWSPAGKWCQICSVSNGPSTCKVYEDFPTEWGLDDVGGKKPMIFSSLFDASSGMLLVSLQHYYNPSRIIKFKPDAPTEWSDVLGTGSMNSIQQALMIQVDTQNKKLLIVGKSSYDNSCVCSFWVGDLSADLKASNMKVLQSGVDGNKRYRPANSMTIDPINQLMFVSGSEYSSSVRSSTMRVKYGSGSHGSQRAFRSVKMHMQVKGDQVYHLTGKKLYKFPVLGAYTDTLVQGSLSYGGDGKMNGRVVTDDFGTQNAFGVMSDYIIWSRAPQHWDKKGEKYTGHVGELYTSDLNGQNFKKVSSLKHKWPYYHNQNQFQIVVQ